MSVKINKAMILAAGRGSRMRDLTNEKPKPMIQVCGKTLISSMVDKVVSLGIKTCVVNLCYLGDIIKNHLSQRTDISFDFSEEETALETGGGVKNALSLLGTEHFFALNADALWTEENTPCLAEMAEAFNPETTDILLLLWPMENVVGHNGKGDYFIENGNARRVLPTESSAPFVYAGAQIINPKVFNDSPDGKFSLVKLYDKAQENGRLKAVVGKGKWFHVGSPEALNEAEEILKGKCL